MYIFIRTYINFFGKGEENGKKEACKNVLNFNALFLYSLTLSTYIPSSFTPFTNAPCHTTTRIQFILIPYKATVFLFHLSLLLFLDKITLYDSPESHIDTFIFFP